MPLLYNLDSLFWRICEEYIYTQPTPPKRVRAKDKPMQVICVGPPRSATESLQRALIMLGYDHTYHGWDIAFEQPSYAEQWTKLAKKKWNGAPDGDCHISAAEFDEIIGHSTAVTDTVASCFAAEIIEAYPDAKVVLNTRTDLDKWHESSIKTIMDVQVDWKWWAWAFFNADLFWAINAMDMWLLPGLFRFPHGSLEVGIRKNGKWIYREHCNMIRGLVPKERLLEWSVEDGWEPLCTFLGKDVPSEEFPNVNSGSVGWKEREKQAGRTWAMRAYRNMGITAAVFVAIVAAAVKLLTWYW